MKKSKAVDEAIRRTYVALANEAAKKAVRSVEWNELHRVDPFMLRVEQWLNKAGARATAWSYRVPQA